LAGVSGNVLDLGCGNGALLGKLCAGRDDLVPFGVDTNGAAIEHARRLLPRHDGNFVQGDLFEPERWSAGGRRYGLALLMLGRLVEAPEDRARRLLDNLEASCSRILVYLYPDWGEQDLATIARRFGLEVKQARDGAVAWLKNEEVPVPSDEVGA